MNNNEKIGEWNVRKLLSWCIHIFICIYEEERKTWLVGNMLSLGYGFKNIWMLGVSSFLFFFPNFLFNHSIKDLKTKWEVNKFINRIIHLHVERLLFYVILDVFFNTLSNYFLFNSKPTSPLYLYSSFSPIFSNYFSFLFLFQTYLLHFQFLKHTNLKMWIIYIQ